MTDRKAPRHLTRGDYEAAKAYAARHPSDQFSYARALSRLAHDICTREDLTASGVGI